MSNPVTPENGFKLRTLALRIVSVVIGLVGGLLVAEVALRASFPQGIPELRLPQVIFEKPEDLPGIPYVLRANSDWTNNLGLRNSRDVSARKSPGVFRLLVVGDSVTAISTTDGVSPDLLYPSFLEKLLQQRLQRPVEVLNLSSPGLSLRQELTLLQVRGLPLNPDLILIAYCYNDPVRSDIATAANVDVVRWSRAIGLFQLWLARRRSWPMSESWYEPDSKVLEELDRTFAELARLAAAHPIVLVPIPARSTEPAEQIHLEAVAQLCRSHRLRCLDIYESMLPYISALEPEPDPDLLHFKSAGHRALAEALAEPVADLIVHSSTLPATR